MSKKVGRQGRKYMRGTWSQTSLVDAFGAAGGDISPRPVIGKEWLVESVAWPLKQMTKYPPDNNCLKEPGASFLPVAWKAARSRW